jgi:cytoskeletal protein CcmA (bactofilin family)
MFGSTKKVEEIKSSANPANPNALNALVKGTAVEGTIRSESDIRIDGTVKGKLTCNAKVIIGPTGYVDGEIKCQNAVIEGKFTGNIHVAELLNVRETAEIHGDVHTQKLNVQAGSIFNVNVHMTDGNGATSNGAGAKNLKDVSTAAIAGGAEKAKN